MLESIEPHDCTSRTTALRCVFVILFIDTPLRENFPEPSTENAAGSADVSWQLTMATGLGELLSDL